MLHTVVISDIHLCEAERESGIWMRYRQAAYSPASEIASMLAAVRARVRGDRLCLVLNGDVFDFDAPRVKGRTSVFHDEPRDAEHGCAALGAILDDHPEFVRALGDVLAEGHELIFVSGNHDAHLTLPAVRELLADRLVEAARVALAQGRPCQPSDHRHPLRDRVRFRAWFHRTDDGIIVEHGHQYDGYCPHREPMLPYDAAERAVQPTMGSLVARHMVARMGYFNPHVDGTYELSALGYLLHWARYYAVSSHSLVVAWAVGAVRTLARLVRARFAPSRQRKRRALVEAARETGTSLLAIARHARLFAKPAEDRLHLVFRVLWVDRVLLCAASVLTALVVGLAARSALLGILVGPTVLLVYELAIPKQPLDAVWTSVQRIARRVAAVHRARAVVFGHTHRADGAWEDGVFYGNSGSWSAAFHDPECTRPLDRARPVIWLRSDDGGRLAGGLARWAGGGFVDEPA